MRRTISSLFLSSHSFAFLSMVRFSFLFTSQFLSFRDVFCFSIMKRDFLQEPRNLMTRSNAALVFPPFRLIRRSSLSLRLQKSPWDTHVYVDTRLVSLLLAGRRETILNVACNQKDTTCSSFCLFVSLCESPIADSTRGSQEKRS